MPATSIRYFGFMDTSERARSHIDRRSASKRDFANEMPAHAVSPRRSASSTRACYTGTAHMWSAVRMSSAPNRQLFGQNAMKSGREGTLQTNAHSQKL